MKMHDYLILLLIVCQVDPLQLGDNLALNCQTYSSGDDFGGTPNLAVDGNTNQLFDGGSCFHSLSNQNIPGHPWWVVKMNVPPGETAIVSRIRLAVRDELDPMTDGWNRDFQFRVGNTFDPSTFHPDQYALCHEHLGQLPLSITIYECDQPLTGVYLSINIPTPGTLMLCEAEVFGQLVPLESITGRFVSKGSMEPGSGVSAIETHYKSSKMHCITFCNLLFPRCNGFTAELISTTRQREYKCVLYEDLTSPLVSSTTKKYYTRGNPVKIG